MITYPHTFLLTALLEMPDALASLENFRIRGLTMTTPPAEAGGFSEQIRGNPPDYVPEAVSRPESPLMHDHRRRNVSV